MYQLNFLGMLLLQEVGFDLRSMWTQMGWAARAVVVLLAVLSAWSIGVMIDRYIAFAAARKQSREFAPAVAGCLKEGKIEEARRILFLLGRDQFGEPPVEVQTALNGITDVNRLEELTVRAKHVSSWQKLLDLNGRRRPGHRFRCRPAARLLRIFPAEDG